MPVKTFTLFSQPYLDRINQCYLDLITLNNMPMGPLKDLVVSVRLPPLSEFKQEGPCSRTQMCVFVLRSPYRCCLMTIDELPELMSYLVENNYSLNKSITKILQKNDTGGKQTLTFVTFDG